MRMFDNIGGIIQIELDPYIIANKTHNQLQLS